MSALSEVLWSTKEQRNWKDFERRLPSIYRRYEQWGANYSVGYYGLQPAIIPAPDNDGVLLKLDSKKKDGNIIYVKGRTTSATFNYNQPILIKSPGEYGAALTRPDHKIIGGWLWEKFSFNKATGKKISITNDPSANYPGSGAFTLVNGIITEDKLSQSSEWLGFLGKDLEAVIDLGKIQTIKSIQVDVLKQEGSWIYLPSSVEFFTSNDGTNFTSVGKLLPDAAGDWPDERHIQQKLNNISSRYIKVYAKNYGVIPQGKPGGGTAAWLFADEIEVD